MSYINDFFLWLRQQQASPVEPIYLDINQSAPGIIGTRVATPLFQSDWTIVDYRFGTVINSVGTVIDDADIMKYAGDEEAEAAQGLLPRCYAENALNTQLAPSEEMPVRLWQSHTQQWAPFRARMDRNHVVHFFPLKNRSGGSGGDRTGKSTSTAVGTTIVLTPLFIYVSQTTQNMPGPFQALVTITAALIAIAIIAFTYHFPRTSRVIAAGALVTTAAVAAHDRHVRRDARIWAEAANPPKSLNEMSAEYARNVLGPNSRQ